MKSRSLIFSVLSIAGVATAGLAWAASPHAYAAPAAERLSETGLYEPGSTSAIRADNLPYAPQYPLWSDGARKRRWLHIPPGTFIDASRPDEWQFPPGTKVWKEFSQGRRVETRLIERLADGSWRFATYVWDEQGRDALLAPAQGIRALAVDGAPGGRYVVPGEADCRACHEGAAVPVLSVSALQLSSARDPLAPHGEPSGKDDLDIRALIARGWLRNLPGALLKDPPRIAARSAQARAALGYLHGNCGHCHNDNGAPPPVDLVLAQKAGDSRSSYAKVLASLVGVLGRYRIRGLPASAPLLDPGHPETSVLVARMRSRDPRIQMPPLGTQFPDTDALAVIERWILDQPQPAKEHDS